jgi:Zn-dependent peptidase ImmA (M78 family)
MTNFFTPQEISHLGECLAHCYFADSGDEIFPVEPEIIATKFFGLDIFPQHQLTSAGVRSGIDTSQSIIFIDHDTYMDDDKQPYARQAIAHELGHAIFDTSLIRQLSATTVEDAFELHQLLVGGQPGGIETRANMLSGAILVPRGQMLKRVAIALAQNYDKALDLFPEITLGQVFEQMASSQLSRHFGVSENVIEWRFNMEELHQDFKANPDTLLTKVNLKLISEIAGMSYKPPPLTEKLRALLPTAALPTYQQQFA